MKNANVVVTGGGGFIGSNLVDRLLALGNQVTVIDNFSGGHRGFLEPHQGKPGLRLLEIDLRDTDKLVAAFPEHVDYVYHLAANADISRGVEDPTLDFEQTIVATFSLLQTMRFKDAKKLIYTSGSGVYGDHGSKYLTESYGPLEPVSMYGASKAGAEALVSAFCHLFEIQAWILRPANIIGPRSTHGVVFDFIRRLKKDPTQLRILGDGKQSKAYLHVEDVLDALFLIPKKGKKRVNFYNLSSNTFITVNEIAQEVIKAMGLKKVKVSRTGGKIGWKGDVAIVRIRNTQIRKIGWRSHYSSKQAVKATIHALLDDPRMES